MPSVCMKHFEGAPPEMHLQPSALRTVKKILAEQVPAYEVWAYGSRVHGRNLKPFSDLDLVVKAPETLPPAKLGYLAEAFSESGLPFKVDISDWKSLTGEFQKKIEESYEVIQPRKTKE